MNDMPRFPLQDIGVVLAAGGQSRRFGSGNKLLAELSGEPVVIRSLRCFTSLVLPAHVILVVSEECSDVFENLLANYGLKDIRMISGGHRRQDSVLNGLLALPRDIEVVLVHDAARPFVTRSAIEKCIDMTRHHRAALLAHRLIETVKDVGHDGLTRKTLDRQTLWAAETPQGAWKNDLIRAITYANDAGVETTDEAQALELIGIAAAVVENRTPNPKLTNAADLEFFNVLAGIRGSGRE